MDFAGHQQLSELQWQVCCAVGNVQVPYAQHQHHVSGACQVLLWPPWSPRVCHARILHVPKLFYRNSTGGPSAPDLESDRLQMQNCRTEWSGGEWQVRFTPAVNQKALTQLA